MAFSASDAAFEGFRIVREKPLSLLGWSLAYFVLIAALLGAIFGILGPDFIAALEADSEKATTPQEAMALLSRMGMLMLTVVPIALIGSAVLSTAVFRAVIRPDERGFAYMRLGGDEFRQLAVLFVLVIVIFAIIAGLGIGIGLAIAAAAAVNDGLGAIVGIVGAIAALCAYIFILVRLSMAAPMTFADKKIRIFESWSFTKGKFWGLLGMYVLVIVFSLLVSLLGTAISYGVAVAAGGGFEAIAGVSNPDFESFGQQMWIAFGLYAVIQVIVAAMQLALSYGASAAAYTQIAEESGG